MALVKHDERYGPYMTANNAPAPYAATASQNNWGAFRAFSESLDDDISFTGLAAGTEQWVQIKLDAAIRIWAFRIACRTTVSAKDAGQVPKNFVVQGSVDGTSFEDIQTYTDVEWSQFTSWDATVNKYDWSASKKIEVTCAKEYQYYRFQFGECQSVSTQKAGSMTPTSANTVKLTLIDLYQVEGDAGAEVTGIHITYPPVKKRYKIGEALDTAGMEVMADMSGGKAQAVTDYTISGYDSAASGQKTVTVTYQGHTATFTVTVYGLSGITITTLPSKTQYNVGDTLDLTGMVVTATYTDGVTEVVTDYTVSGFDSGSAGTKAVTVTYQDETVMFEVSIVESKVVTGIEVASLPAKTDYNIGDAFAPAGLIVNLIYEDGSKAATADYALAGFDSTEAGRKTITVSYGEFSATFTVFVGCKKFVLGTNVIGVLNLTTYDLVISGSGAIDNRPLNDNDFKNIKTCVIEDGITSICKSAFSGCERLTSVTIPDSVSTIGQSAFNLCKGLTSVTIPGSVDTIEVRVFAQCYKLESVTIGNGVVHIGNMAFYQCDEKLVSVSIPESVETIGSSAFGMCAKLQDVTVYNPSADIYDSASTLGNASTIRGMIGSTAEAYAEKYNRTFIALDAVATGIEVVSLPDKVVYDPGEEFDATGLAVNLVYSDGKTEVVVDYELSGYDSTAGTKTITVTHQEFTTTFTVTVRNIVTEEIGSPTLSDVTARLDLDTGEMIVSGTGDIKDFASNTSILYEHKNAVKTVVVNEGITSIGAYAFQSGKASSVTLPVGLLSIGERAFSNNTADINIPETVESIGQSAFSGSGLTNNLTIPASVKHIGTGVFEMVGFLKESGAQRLEYLSDADIPEYFCRGSVFTEIIINGNVKKIGTMSFDGCRKLVNVQLSDAITEIGRGAFGSCPSLVSVRFPQQLAVIGDMAFMQCTALKDIILPSGLNTLGEQCFAGTAIENIEIPGSMVDWGRMCFAYCPSLRIVKFLGGLEKVGNSAFNACPALERIEFAQAVKRIEQSAFTNCTKLTEVELPVGMEEIGGYVFSGCTSLNKITVMNRNMTIQDDENGLYSGAAIHGWTGSTAEAYATKYSRTFVPLDGTVAIEPLYLVLVSPPDRLVYTNHDTELDTTGLVVGTFNTDGSTTNVTGYELSGFDVSTLGKKTITITYLEWSVEFEIDVFVSFTVTFKDLYGNVLKEETVAQGGSATPPDVPEIPGFVLSGWSNSYENVMADTVCQAQYAAQTYTVDFKDYDGTTIDTQQVRYGDDATPPADPTREGYLFAGWDKPYSDIAADTIITATYVADVKVTSIQVSDIEIKNGDLKVLPYTVLPTNATNKSVSLESGDKSIASIGEDGTLQANNAGSTTITILALDGSGVTASCAVTVTADTEVTSLWLIPSEFYLQIGKTSSITADIIAGDDADTALLWTSSDTKIATVDKTGKVKGIAVGTAMITARLKSDAAIFATSKVDVIAKEDYIRELYADDSVHKETVIHSVDGKFADITNADIKAESMIIKEAVCGSAPAYLGGCISNSFEILVHTKRFFNKAPSGEIQVYQKVGGVKVNLFHGIIDSAKKQEDRITRKLIAYDKMHTAGDVNVSSWFKKLKFPITVGSFRKKLFKKIGISHQGVKLPCDDFKINKNYVYYTDSNEDVPTIAPNKKTDKKHDLYSVPDTIKAVDVIRDICEVSGTWGWMNRTGTFEYVDPYVFDLDYITGEKEKKYLHPIKIQDDNKSYAVKAVELYLDDKEIDPLVYVWGGGSYSNKRKYSLDDSNFIVSATRGAWMSPKNYNTCEMAIVEEIAKTMHDKSWVSFTCTQRFDPTIRIGTDVYYENMKELSDGTSYKWTTYSAILERTIRGCHSMLETVSASIGPLSSSSNKKKKTVDKTKKTEKVVSDLKQEVSSLGSNYYDNGGGSGGGLKAVSVTELPSDPDSNTIYLIQGEVTVE